jgi:hypothetical protein
MNVEIISIVATLAVAGIGAIVGHFVSLNKLKDKIHQLEIEQERLKNRDEIQQIVIDQLKEIFPIVKGLIENGNNKRLK